MGILSAAQHSVAQIERDHHYASESHGPFKTSQISHTTNDILHLKLNTSGAISLRMLAYLAGVGETLYYSPRDLAPYVIASDICLPGVVVSRKASRNLKKSVVKQKDKEAKGTLRKNLMEENKWFRKRLQAKFDR